MLSFLYGAPLAPGTPAPDFTLTDDQGNTVSLRSLRGRNVVLVFYPKDETPICRGQLCDFRDHWADASARNTVVFGVNPGDSKSHSKFRERNRLPFPLLVDEGSAVAKAYSASGLLWPVRTVYLIGPDGRIAFAKRGKPAASEVLAAAA